MNNWPIGIFDSGVGGLTVARAIIDQLPNEQVLYVGDTANTPYGNKPIAQVRELALAVMDDLVSQGVKLLTIACNTASAAVLRDARERYTITAGIPVVEVIQPAVRRAVSTTRNGRIGVIGTTATISSCAYIDAFAAAPHMQITQQDCPRFVEFAEAGITTGPELLKLAEEYLEPIRQSGVDTLILGCTHYPLLAASISYVVGDNVSLVSSAEESAYDVYRALVDNDLLCAPGRALPEHKFTDTGNSAPFVELAGRIMGSSLDVTGTDTSDDAFAGRVDDVVGDNVDSAMKHEAI